MIICTTAGSVVCFLRWSATSDAITRALIIGFGLYRLLDIALTLLGLGVFGSVRHEAALQELPRHRVQRILVAILLNYIEMLFWFALLYRAIATRDPSEFSTPLTAPRHAFYISISTITTLGYGQPSPVGAKALAVATVQVVMGLVLLLMVISGLVGSLGEDAAEVIEQPLSGPRRYLVHAITPFVAYAFCAACAHWLFAP